MSWLDLAIEESNKPINVDVSEIRMGTDSVQVMKCWPNAMIHYHGESSENYRLIYLANWLQKSLMHLAHPMVVANWENCRFFKDTNWNLLIPSIDVNRSYVRPVARFRPERYALLLGRTVRV